MGELSTSNAALTAREESATAAAVPTQVLARWAAVAGERSVLGFLPTQVVTG
jgi:hypothetical protein